ncbi:single-stranded DNA-binding protein [Lamprobacter modestohalophilus]|uniref:single-stranded DNA-binding protein n=1 Tax=Lamprobacter modestohalophilus TaxID=1064514 RepID=UPI002ADEF4BB|nr:single-stranded DNA-binding protein [Lamprobacter modestohalophilus]MCF7993234.1 single-stranded DNA-binding protein [Chromatiaceae bacterium]MCF8004569.1 single-stranded DNA-binding protein [Chromatiaceae bacterium]MCF8015266.1 single-stranded DNA-binding protein [Chromatiaceae bacterium]MEA1049095.1 single-stranded DNA-binding protein [Lamprobacter modestohalophilus]
MSGINTVILVGHLGDDPELRALRRGDRLAHFPLATEAQSVDPETGELRTRTEWHRVTCFGPAAERAADSLRKGLRVYLEGSLRTRPWTTADGQARTTTEVVISQRGVLHLLDEQPQSTPALSG